MWCRARWAMGVAAVLWLAAIPAWSQLAGNPTDRPVGPPMVIRPGGSRQVAAMPVAAASAVPVPLSGATLFSAIGGRCRAPNGVVVDIAPNACQAIGGTAPR